MSKSKAESFSDIDDVMYEIPRAREVGQNWFTSLFYTIYAFMKILPLVLNSTTAFISQWSWNLCSSG